MKDERGFAADGRGADGGLAEFGGRRPPLQGYFRNEIKLIFPGEGFGMLSA